MSGALIEFGREVGPSERDGGYHQGPVWGWLLGPFAVASARASGDLAAARSFLEPAARHLADYGLGSAAELLPAWDLLADGRP